MGKKFFDIIPPKQKQDQGTEFLDKRNSVPLEKIKKKGFFLKSLVFCFVLLILVIISGFFLFSKVEVEIWPEIEILNLEENLVIDLNVEIPVFDEKIIPGRVFSNEKSASQEFFASSKVLKEEKATGVIRVYNAHSTSSRTLVPSRFVSADGKLFWSVKKIVIPGARYEKGKLVPGEIDVEVQAAEPGEDYNIGPSTFALPALAGSSLYTTIYGRSFSDMSNGFIGEASQISQEDIEKAEIALTEELKKQSREFFKTTVPKDFVLLDETISQEIIEASSSLEAGTEAESFVFQVKIKSEGIGFKRSDLENFAKSRINLNMSEGAILQEESLEINYSFLEEKIDEEGKIVLSLEIKAKVYSDIDLDKLKKALLGKSIKEARIFLENLPGVIKVELKSWPFLKSKIPEDMQEIEVRLMLD
ncbi:hypothetical protein KJ841_00155 [Patescibacteria group bacterium]|nr:hypothetical protein [Patescibacteria group bacterium]